MCIIYFMSFGQYDGGVVDCFGMYNVVGWFNSISSTKTELCHLLHYPHTASQSNTLLTPRYLRQCTRFFQANRHAMRDRELNAARSVYNNVVMLCTPSWGAASPFVLYGNCTLNWLFPRSSLLCTHMSPPDVCLLYRVWPILHLHIYAIDTFVSTP